MKTVLIVDDESDIAEILAALLAAEGYRVETAPDGHQALQRLASTRPDVVLLDVMMPVLDGREVCRAIRENPEHASLPVVIMSAGGSISQEDCAYDALIKKPFDFDALLETISLLTRSSGEAPRAPAPKAGRREEAR